MTTNLFRTARTLAAVTILFAAFGCEDPTSTDGSLIAATRIGDAYYGEAGLFNAESEMLGEQIATVRFVDCSEGIWLDENTHVSDYCRLEDGDSNTLPTGTAVFVVEGVDPLERLAARKVVEGETTEAGDPVTEIVHLVRIDIAAPAG